MPDQTRAAIDPAVALAFGGLLTLIPDAAVLVEADGRIAVVNDAACELFGYEPDDLAGRSVEALVPGPRREVHAALRAGFMAEARRRPMGSDLELVALRKDGTEVAVEISLAPVEAEGRTLTLAVARDVGVRRRAAEALRESEERFRTMFEASPLGITVLGSDGRVVRCNEAFCRLVGYAEAELRTLHFGEYTHPDDLAGNIVLWQELLDGKRDGFQFEKRYRTKDGQVLWGRLTATAVRDAEGGLSLLFTMVEDLGERRELERQLVQSQKMEAVGQLAGGIAHDFNNLLTAVRGNADLLLEQIETGDPRRARAEQIVRAAEMAISLTRQLLAFARRQMLQPEATDLSEIVRSLHPLLASMLGERVELVLALGREPVLALIDRSQIEQVIVNLAVNAGDAMPQGGTLTLATCAVALDGSERAPARPVPGRYAEFTVADTGVGMDEHVLERIFEPFFTTKELGKGTGLGLSTVYGIVKQSGGYVWADSEPGLGTTFTVQLPWAESVSKPARRPEAEPASLGGNETILLVEDADVVRGLIREVLEGYGYRVVEAAGGEAALEAADRVGSVDLILTDVVLPRISGPRLAETLLERLPGTRVLFMSSYVEDALLREGLLDPDVLFLEKPFTIDELARKVREALDAPQ